MYDRFADFDDHMLISSRFDASTHLSAIIAVHNDARGPAIGGCRMLPYASIDAAITDALRLSRGMTYKNAIADIPYGGGKAVVIADPRTQKSEALLHAFGDFVESLGGRYITSFDSGTTLEDIDTIGQRTSFAAGTLAEAGNASASTALGVYHCMRAAAEMAFGSAYLGGVTIAIEGVGNVGSRLAEMLSRDGANLIVADADGDKAAVIAERLGARLVPAGEILQASADIYAPCALGATLSPATISALSARAVVGAANNQLATPDCDEQLRAAGILYCPDYLANAGGIVDLHYQLSTWSADAVARHVAGLADTFREAAERARARQCGTGAIVDAIAWERVAAATRRT